MFSLVDTLFGCRMEEYAMNARRKLPSTTKRPTRNKTSPKLIQAIRLRAYILFEQRGKKHGHDLDDWLQAEAELTAASALLDASCSGWLSLPH